MDKLRAYLDAAETAAGAVYAKVAGTYQTVETWDEQHPDVQAAAQTAEGLLKAAGFDVTPEVNLAKLVWGRLGLLLAADPTVQGPTVTKAEAPTAASTASAPAAAGAATTAADTTASAPAATDSTGSAATAAASA